MEFRKMTEQDWKIAEEHPLYPNGKKEVNDVQDFDFTFEHDGQVMCVGGFRMITETSAWGWIQLTEYSKEHLVPSIRVVKEWMEEWCKNHSIIRLQAWVATDFIEGMRTVEHFGFRRECLLNDFLGKDKPAVLYAKIMR